MAQPFVAWEIPGTAWSAQAVSSQHSGAVLRGQLPPRPHRGEQDCVGCERCKEG